MDEKIRLELSVSTEHIDSCNSCFSRNYEPTLLFPVGEKVDRLYKLKVGMMTVTLCPKCLARLRGMIEVAESEAEGGEEDGADAC